MTDKSKAPKVGIYLIINKKNGNFYIGSTKFFTRRFAGHRADLRRNKHGSQYLQNAYNKYGESNFVFHKFLILPLDTSEEVLLNLETNLLQTFKPVYNMVLHALRSQMSEHGKKIISEKSSKKYILTSPDGEEREVLNMFKFCKEKGIRPKGLYEIAAGRGVSYMGWKARHFGEARQRKIDKKKKLWIVTNPEGNKETVDNLSDFCRKNRIRKGGLSHGLTIGSRLYRLGWRCENLNKEERIADNNNAKYYEITFPNGKIEIIHNLLKFCTKNEIPYHTMTNILSTQKPKNGYNCKRSNK